MASNKKGSGKGPDRVQKGDLQFFGDFMCMRGDSLAVHEKEKPPKPDQDDRRTATATAYGGHAPISYGVFGGSEILVASSLEGSKGKQQEIFVHVDGIAPKNVPDKSNTAFDAGSGISEEEQQEILVQINGIAEKNRQSLSTETENGDQGARKRLNAKKNGGLFPVLVNFFVVAALIGGLYALYSLQDEADVLARQETRVFNPMERTIIEEIRRETTDMLEVKDMEIAIITHFLADIEMQMEIIAGSEVLTPEQLATYGQLRERQEGLRRELIQAQEGRSRILNEAHVQEAVLQAQFNTRIQIETQMREFFANGEVPPLEKLAAHEQLRSQQEEFREALARAREERSMILNETRAREAELQAQLDVRTSVEAQLRELIASGMAMTPEQRAAYERLRSQQEELSGALALAWEERSLILDEARAREAELQAQLNARIHDLDPRHTPAPELEVMHDEFARLSMEQAQAERAEILIASLFASARRQIAENRFHEADETIISLRMILNDPAFQASSATHLRREFYVHATDTLEELLTRYGIANEAMRIGVLPPDRDAEIRLEQEIARLTEKLEAMEHVINTMYMAEADWTQLVTQLENSIGNLQSTNASLNSQMGSLQSENTIMNSRMGTLQQDNTALNSRASNLQSENAALNSQVGSIQQENETLNSQVGTLQQDNITLNSQMGNLRQENTTLNSQMGNLQQENTALNSRVSGLQSANTTLNSQVGSLQQENTALNSRVGNLQQENATLNSRVGTLQADISRQAQATENLRQDVQSLRTTNMSLSNQLNQLREALLHE